MNKTKDMKFRKPFAVFFFSTLFLGVLPIFSSIFGYQFLPTAKWVSQAFWPSVGFGVATGLIYLWFTPKGLAQNPKANGPIKTVLVVVAAPFFGFFLGTTAFTVGGPLVVSAIIGKDTEARFKVLAADGGNSKYCTRPIKLEGLPFAMDDLCGVPQSLRGTLHPGTTVSVDGRGTSLGVFPSQVTIIE